MTQEQFRTRVERAEREVFVITSAENGWRVRSASRPSQFYLVSQTESGLSCSCPDYESHAAEEPAWTCKHMLAVQGHEAQQSSVKPAEGKYEEEERNAIQEEASLEKAESEKLPTQMQIKRSVSPDGRIDSVSLEFTTPVTGLTAAPIKSQALRILRLQNEIVKSYLKANSTAKAVGRGNGTPRPAENNAAAPARLVDVGVMNGQYGERYFVNVEVNGRRARLFGNLNQIADAIAAAGGDLVAEEIEPGVRLNLPCKALTAKSTDGRYVNVTRVLPANGDARVRS